MSRVHCTVTPAGYEVELASVVDGFHVQTLCVGSRATKTSFESKPTYLQTETLAVT